MIIAQLRSTYCFDEIYRANCLLFILFTLPRHCRRFSDLLFLRAQPWNGVHDGSPLNYANKLRSNCLVHCLSSSSPRFPPLPPFPWPGSSLRHLSTATLSLLDGSPPLYHRVSSVSRIRAANLSERWIYSARYSSVRDNSAFRKRG